MPDSTYNVEINKCAIKRRVAFERGPEDGLAISLLKMLFGCRLFYGWYLFAWLAFLFPCMLKKSQNEQVIKLGIHHSVEYYVYLWLMLLLIIYLDLYFCTVTLREIGKPALTINCFAWLGVAIAIYRLLDLISVTVDYNLARPVAFEAAVPPRTMLLVIANYLEITVAFAIFYVVVHLFGDQFSAKTWPGDFGGDCITPLYFSFVTITTLGFGDFSPNSWQGRVCVLLEVSLGFMLLLVVLQRVLSAKHTPFPDQPAPGA